MLLVTSACVKPQTTATPFIGEPRPPIIVDIPTELKESDIANRVFACTENNASFKLSNSDGVIDAHLVFLKDGEQVGEPYPLKKDRKGFPGMWETTFSLSNPGMYQAVIKISYGPGTKEFNLGTIEVEGVQVPIVKEYLVPENVAYNVKTPISITLACHNKGLSKICFNIEGDNSATIYLGTVDGLVYRGEAVVPEGKNIAWTIEAEDYCDNVIIVARGTIKRSFEFIPDITLPSSF